MFHQLVCRHYSERNRFRRACGCHGLLSLPVSANFFIYVMFMFMFMFVFVFLFVFVFVFVFMFVFMFVFLFVFVCVFFSALLSVTRSAKLD